jgi:hypothetical protein
VINGIAPSASLPRQVRGKCISEGPCGAIVPSRLHNGLPVISEAEFNAGYDSKSDENEVRIFNFRGYVERADGTLRFTDVTALNGLRGGVHVGIDGVTSYWNFGGKASGPSDVGEFVVYAIVPPATQKSEGVVCIFDSCYDVSEYREKESKYCNEKDVSKEIDKYQATSGYIVTRLTIDPRMPGAREAISVLSIAISEYLKQGFPLDGLESFLRSAEERLISRSRMPDGRQGGTSETGPAGLLESMVPIKQ